MKRFLGISLVSALMVLVPAAGARADGHDPSHDADRVRDWGQVSIPADTGPQFVPSITDTAAGSFDLSTRTSLTTLTVAPLRPMRDSSALWGLQAMISYDSDKKRSTIGLNYRIDPRWISAPPEPSDEADPQLDGLASIHARRTIAAQTLSLLHGEKSFERANAQNQYLLMIRARNEVGDAAGTLRYVRGGPEAAKDIDGAIRDGIVRFEDPIGTVDERASAWKRFTDAFASYANVLTAASKDYDGPAICGPGRDECTSESLGIYNERRVWRESLFTARALLPAITIGYNLSINPFDFDVPPKTKQNLISGSTFKAGLSWRLATYVEFDGTFSAGISRAAAHDDPSTPNANEITSVRGISGSAAAVVIIPQLLGTTYFDGYFYDNSGYQRGIGVGASFSIDRCLESIGQQNCPNKGHVEDRFIGGIVDLRITKTVRPRIRLGSRRVVRFDKDASAGVDASAFLAFAVE